MQKLLFLIFVILLSSHLFITVDSYKNQDECNFCELVMGSFLTFLNESSSEQEMEEVFDAVCSLLPNSLITRCYHMATRVATFLATLPKMASREEFSPYALCSMYEYCQIQCCVSKLPEQVHLAFGTDSSKMAVNWVTADKVDSIVMYGKQANNLNLRATGTVKTYTDGGWLGWIHEVVLSNLDSGTQYFYKVGSDASGWSKVFNFYTEKNFVNNQTPFKVIIYGDQGADPQAGPIISRVQQLVQSHAIDFIFHDGDISYDDGFQQRWDRYMRMIEDIAANTAYMVTPGNHEIGIIGLLNVTLGYIHRFTLPGELAQTTDLENLVYSFNYGNAHFVAIDTESDMDVPKMSNFQLSWLEKDLKSVDRKKYPWIIVCGHRPMYCSNSDSECASGVGGFSIYLRNKLEPLFLKYNVDLVFTAHKHSYERTWPVSSANPVFSYNNPKIPAYLVVGTGGNREGNANFGKLPNWSAKAIPKNGYGILTFFNNTQLKWDYYLPDQTDPVDSFVLNSNK